MDEVLCSYCGEPIVLVKPGTPEQAWVGKTYDCLNQNCRCSGMLHPSDELIAFLRKMENNDKKEETAHETFQCLLHSPT